MADQAPAHLLDTNILLRLSKRDSPEFPSIRNALGILHSNQAHLCYTSQNLVEFWNVSTRPREQNGHGLSPAETDAAATRIERAFTLLPDVDAIHREWRRIVVAYGVSGVNVHDARLVAAMNVHGVHHILTLNGNDFARYKEIVIVHPAKMRA